MERDHRNIIQYWNGGDPPPPLTPAGKVWGYSNLPEWIRMTIDISRGNVIPSRVYQHEANVARVGLLYEFGGVWLDHDMEVHGAIPEGVFVGRHENGTPCNCVMSFPSRHPLLARLLEIILRPIRGHWSGPTPPRPATEISGEVLLGRHISDYPDVEVVDYGVFAVHHRWTSGIASSMHG